MNGVNVGTLKYRGHVLKVSDILDLGYENYWLNLKIVKKIEWKHKLSRVHTVNYLSGLVYVSKMIQLFRKEILILVHSQKCHFPMEKMYCYGSKWHFVNGNISFGSWENTSIFDKCKVSVPFKVSQTKGKKLEKKIVCNFTKCLLSFQVSLFRLSNDITSIVLFFLKKLDFYFII